ADHEQLVEFVTEAQLDWCGFFAYSEEAGTYAADLDGAVDPALLAERLAQLRDLQEDITIAKRDELVGSPVSVLVDVAGEGRSYREAPEIDGVVLVPPSLAPGTFVDVDIVEAEGPDLVAGGGVVGLTSDVVELAR